MISKNTRKHKHISIMTSQLEKVKEFNRAFNLEVPENVQTNFFTQDTFTVNLKMKLIREEMEELEEAVRNKDVVETADAIGDLLYVLDGMAISMGLPMDDIFDHIHESNMSKLCDSLEQAEETVAWYKEHPEKGYDTPMYRPCNHPKLKDKYVIYNGSTGKILKNKYYKAVNMKPFLEK